jgi:hypothetical protein
VRYAGQQKPRPVEHTNTSMMRKRDEDFVGGRASRAGWEIAFFCITVLAVEEWPRQGLRGGFIICLLDSGCLGSVPTVIYPLCIRHSIVCIYQSTQLLRQCLMVCPAH